MEIREGGPDDAEALCDLTATVWRAAYVDVLGEETVEEHLAATNDPETTRAAFAEYDLTAFVVGDPVVAQAFCRPDEAGDQLHLTQLYVHPDHWRDGIGSALLDRVETEARDLGVETVDLVVLAENSVGRGFYEGHGYERVRERGERVDDGVRELVYEKPIA
jgi:ribosomal protein S18 acetylase RimI-like enzyme